LKVTSDPNAGTPLEPAAGAPSKSPAPHPAPTSVAASTEKSSAVSGVPAVPLQPSTSVSFRRDSTGRVYYVVSDSNSGKEILEVPPENVRAVGEGIEDYLKHVESQSTPHVETKA